MLDVDKKYVFFQLGGNQVQTSTKDKLFLQVLEIVLEVRKVCENSRILFVGVLPRPVDNEIIKPFIVKFNRWLAAACAEVDSLFDRVKFVPAHLKFLHGDYPRTQMFNQDDLLTLNEAGAKLLHNTIFEQAGFVRNAS